MYVHCTCSHTLYEVSWVSNIPQSIRPTKQGQVPAQVALTITEEQSTITGASGTESVRGGGGERGDGGGGGALCEGGLGEGDRGLGGEVEEGDPSVLVRQELGSAHVVRYELVD